MKRKVSPVSGLPHSDFVCAGKSTFVQPTVGIYGNGASWKFANVSSFGGFLQEWNESSDTHYVYRVKFLTNTTLMTEKFITTERKLMYVSFASVIVYILKNARYQTIFGAKAKTRRKSSLLSHLVWHVATLYVFVYYNALGVLKLLARNIGKTNRTDEKLRESETLFLWWVPNELTTADSELVGEEKKRSHIWQKKKLYSLPTFYMSAGQEGTSFVLVPTHFK